MIDPLSLTGYFIGVGILLMIFFLHEVFYGEKLKPLTSTSSTVNSEKLKLGILGMPGSGKTSLLNFLDKKERIVGGQSFDTPYEAFEYTFNDKTTVKVGDGLDIPGAKESRQQHMQSFLNQKDIIIYMFDIKKYLEESIYEKETNSDLEYISSHLRYKNKSSKVCVLLSHIDSFKSTTQKAKKLDEFKKRFRKLSYANVVFDNFAVVNTTDKEHLIIIEKKLFPC